MITEPADTPFTVPALLTVAMAILLLDQLPPATEAVNAIELPLQTEVEPAMEPAVAVVFTVTLVVAVAEPQVPLTM